MNEAGLLMNGAGLLTDSSLVAAAFVGLALTTTAILRDARHRIGLLRATALEMTKSS